ncbi:hypothetical protein RIF29_18806 [Crotalaria pallida]|uniref:WAT1-related protein n=1 Tax=Crotalaria pallida TaxID=3830 RepID=A0AAN9F034_CROPI
MARRWSFYKDLLPVIVMIGIECNDTGLLTLFKAATNKGMSSHVFVAYAYAIATLVLLPAPFFSKRSGELPPINFSILSKIALLGVIGSSSQILGYVGISYSSPTLATSIGNLVPAFTFMLAVIFSMNSNKVSILLDITNVEVLKEFPDELTMVFFYNVIATIVTTTGVFGKSMSNVVYAWAIHLKGPVYVTSFKPLAVVIAIAMGVMFLDDTLHVGSIFGATIVRGKAKEEAEEYADNLESPSTENSSRWKS